ncbi:hypothetical protein [Streptomyces sp. NBC_00893]|uniref:hypothetical protein n=1 Tax=Streptomyces sp. NBC_00893 TaxID=2975862 RepID=UPI00224DF09C|nr:hypothetical protein [Streptomyces sp. NBC_00893]MCX4847343.1 hypothetical protein [Streptomyces sp. NBC_00893]
MSSVDPGPGPGVSRDRGTSKVESTGTGAPAIGTIGDHATFSWVRGHSLTQDSWLPLSACVVLVVTVGFTIFAAVRWPGGPQSQYAGFYVLVVLALLTAGAAALYPAVQTVDAWRRRRVRTVLVGIAALCFAGGVLTWIDVDRTGEVDVAMTTREAGAGGVFTVEMAPPRSGDVRSKLRLTLNITDKSSTQSSCISGTRATITADHGDPSGKQEVTPRRPTADFDLGGYGGGVRFTVTMKLSDSRCHMDLWARGTLHND